MPLLSTPRPCVRSITRAAVISITGGVSIDPDAAAYIALIEGDGVTVSSVQREAINDWYVTGKAEGWYSSLARHYLPIWANASANARCMVSGTGGTFAGTVTHAAGYVRGDGATGYFNTGVAIVDLGLTSASGLLGVLKKTNGTSGSVKRYWGAFDNASKTARHATSTTTSEVDYCTTSAGKVTYASTRVPSIESFLRTGGRHYYTRRTGSGYSTLGDSLIADAGSPPSEEMFFMGINFQGAASGQTDAEFGAFYVGEGVTQPQEEEFTEALKDLWETCTGLTLP